MESIRTPISSQSLVLFRIISVHDGLSLSTPISGYQFKNYIRETKHCLALKVLTLSISSNTHSHLTNLLSFFLFLPLALSADFLTALRAPPGRMHNTPTTVLFYKITEISIPFPNIQHELHVTHVKPLRELGSSNPSASLDMRAIVQQHLFRNLFICLHITSNAGKEF